jgi:hypothetical protein
MTANQAGERDSGRLSREIWVPIVVLVGVLVGLMIDLLSRPNFGGPRPPFEPYSFRFELIGDFHVILSTTGIALIIALLVVYARTYSETKGNFALGLLVVLSALLFQAALSYPVTFGFVERVSFRPGFSSPIADLFMITAYTVFLYLSLE